MTTVEPIGLQKPEMHFVPQRGPTVRSQWRAKERKRLGLSGETVANVVTQGFAVDGFAFEAGAGGFDYGAHLL